MWFFHKEIQLLTSKLLKLHLLLLPQHIHNMSPTSLKAHCQYLCTGGFKFPLHGWVSCTLDHDWLVVEQMLQNPAHAGNTPVIFDEFTVSCIIIKRLCNILMKSIILSARISFVLNPKCLTVPKWQPMGLCLLVWVGVINAKRFNSTASKTLTWQRQRHWQGLRASYGGCYICVKMFVSMSCRQRSVSIGVHYLTRHWASAICWRVLNVSVNTGGLFVCVSP